MKCIGCGTENPENSRFCHNCGEKLDKVSNPIAEIYGESTPTKKSKRKIVWGVFAGVLLCGLAFLVYRFVLFPKGGDASRFSWRQNQQPVPLSG